MEMTVKERLIRFYEAKGLSKSGFEKMVGLSNGYIDKLRICPSNDKLETIYLKFPDLNRIWLLTGEGEMFLSTDNDMQYAHGQEQPARRTQDSHVGVPYYNVDFELGFDFMANDQTVSPEYMIDCVPYNKCDAWCNAWGDSMRPTISSGDIIALKEVRDPKSCLINNDIYAIVTTNELRTIKRVKDNGSTLTLIPDNKECQEQIIDKELLLKVYRVMGTMKRF